MRGASWQTWLERLPLARRRPWLGYGGAVLLAGLGLGARLAAEGVIPPGFPYVGFFPAVMLAAFLFGLGPGVMAAMLCGLLAWFLFIGPQAGFRLTEGALVALLFYVFVVAMIVLLTHWMQRANRRLVRERAKSETLAETRALLFGELQHRVSNNLQVVGALLALQRKNVADPVAAQALDDAARRLSVIGRLHRQLYDPAGGRLGMKPFLDRLCADALEAAGRNGIGYAVSADEGIDLAADAAIPVALIVAEAVANALEHGFGDRDEGRIEIDLRRTGDGLQLDVRDDGRGLPAAFDAAASPSLGLRIARLLARQLGGSFTLFHDGRTVARLSLPG